MGHQAWVARELFLGGKVPKKQQCNVICICGGNAGVVVPVATLAGTGAAVLGHQMAGCQPGCAAGQNRFCTVST